MLNALEIDILTIYKNLLFKMVKKNGSKNRAETEGYWNWF